MPPMTKQERLARAPEAISERIQKARATKPAVTVKADKVFTVANGDGHSYEVSFEQAKTGACTCEDFATRGKLLCMCKHTAAAVLSQWPDNFDRWEARVRALSLDALNALPDDPQPAAADAPDPQPVAITVTVDAALVAAAIEAALPIVMEAMLDALAANAEIITAKTVAALLASRALAATEVQQ